MKHEHQLMPRETVFGDVPATVHTRFAATLDGLDNEKSSPQRRRMTRVVLITALCLTLLTAAVYAATTAMNVSGFYDAHMGGVAHIPEAGQALLEASPTQSYTLGPVTITLRDAIADSEGLFFSSHVQMADGSQAVFMPGNMTHDALPSTHPLWQEGKALTYLQAAQESGLPLYAIYIRQADMQYSGGQTLLWDADGSLLVISMEERKATPGETIASVYEIKLHQLDSTGSVMDGTRYTQLHTVAVAVQGVMARQRFDGQGQLFEGTTIALSSVTLEQTPLAVYAIITADAGDTPQDITNGMWFSLLDGEGRVLPAGLTPYASEYVTGEYPQIVQRVSLGLEALPDSITVQPCGLQSGAEAGSITLTGADIVK